MLNDVAEKDTVSRNAWSSVLAKIQTLQGQQQAASQQANYDAYYSAHTNAYAPRAFSGVAQQQIRASQLKNEEATCALSRAYNAESKLAAAYAEITLLHDALKVRIDERDALKQVAATGDAPNIDYHGTKDLDGLPVPDPVHENFHRAVGDVLAGKVMSAARKQMEDALGKAPKDKVPFPTRASIPFLEKGVRL